MRTWRDLGGTILKSNAKMVETRCIERFVSLLNKV